MAIGNAKVWLGSKPSCCDLCKTILGDEFVDGRIQGRSCWAILCPPCHLEIGVGLGTGYGQMYRKTGDE
jgi:hypothetical protein